MPSTCPMRKAYSNHQQRAKRSGIAFLFSFEEWKEWWITNLGPEWMKKRGRNTGQYVMARNGNKGPYVSWNVRCITCQENNSEARHLSGEDSCRSKLTEAQVIEARGLYVPHSTKYGRRALARKYGIGHTAMGRCLKGDSWREIEGNLATNLGPNYRKPKLTIEKVQEARRVYIPKHPERGASALARKHGVCVQTMWECLTGKTWHKADAGGASFPA